MDNENLVQTNQVSQSTGREVTVHNPDAFDVGYPTQQNFDPRQQQTDIVTRVIQNPDGVINSFDLTEQQLENIVAAIAGIGAGIGSGLTTKHLSRTFGPEFAAALGGAIGGLLGGYAGKRVVRGRKSRSRFIEG